MAQLPLVGIYFTKISNNFDKLKQTNKYGKIQFNQNPY